MDVLAHPGPMKRHTKTVQPARLELMTRHDAGQVHLVLTHADGSTQRIIVAGAVISELALLIKMAAGGL